MKTIHLIRHAKSSWEDSRLCDVNRPLAQRGINDCKIMGKHLLDAGWNPVNVFCSKAQRAQLTIKGIAAAIKHRDISWTVDDALYTFSYPNLLDWIENLDDGINEVTMVGHNPAFTDFVNKVSDDYLSNIPTCAYVQLKADTINWSKIFIQQIKLAQFIKPKTFKKK